MAADRLQVPRAFGDWHDLVADPAIQIIAIAVPPLLQPTIALAAAQAGKHIFCEKPIAASLDQASALLGPVRAAGIAHAVDFLFPELPAWRRAERLIKSGTLGRLRHAHLSWRTEIAALHRPWSWKLQAEDGGGTLNSFVSHSLFYLEWLFGPIRVVCARLGPSGGVVETQVDAWLECGEGLPVNLTVAADAFLGSGHRLEVYGDDGTLVLATTNRDHVSDFALSLGRRPAESLEQVRVETDGPGDHRVQAAARIVHRLVDHILGGTPARPDLEDGLHVQRLLEAIRLSRCDERSETL